MNELAHFRNEVDQFMGFHPQSPLSADQRADFDGLPYFAENEALILAVEVAQFAATEPMIEMETSTGEQRPYRRWGRFSFTSRRGRSQLNDLQRYLWPRVFPTIQRCYKWIRNIWGRTVSG